MYGGFWRITVRKNAIIFSILYGNTVLFFQFANTEIRYSSWTPDLKSSKALLC